MRCSRFHFPRTIRCAAMFTAFGLTGCGNSCFVAFSNNGNGGVIVKAVRRVPQAWSAASIRRKDEAFDSSRHRSADSSKGNK